MGASHRRFRLEPLSASSYRVELTASAELVGKIEQARELLSHVLPNGDLASILERALDQLIAHETRRRMGAGAGAGARAGGGRRSPRKVRTSRPGSRYVPRDVAGLVWERDGGQCSFTDEQGRRCSERRFLTLEHRHPHALGGPATVENLCLLCAAHNAQSAREVFGEEYVAKKCAEKTRDRTQRRRHAAARPEQSLRLERPELKRPGQPEQSGRSEQPEQCDQPRRTERGRRIARPRRTEQPEAYAKVHFALRKMGFREKEAGAALAELANRGAEPAVEPLLRAALALLAPTSS
jgi:hypothetical protein